MSVIPPTASSAGGVQTYDPASDPLGRALGRLAASLPAPAVLDVTTATTAGAALGGQSRQAQAALADVQTGISYVQTAGACLHRMSGILAKMAALTSQPGAPAAAASDATGGQAFTALQQQLLGLIGGTAGGAAPEASFQGVALFDGRPGPAVTGPTAGAPLTVPGADLRAGAMGALLQQSAAGGFTLSRLSAAAPGTVAAAQQQVAAQQAALEPFGAPLTAAAARLQVEAANLGAALAPLDASGVQDATTAVQADMRAQPLLALAAHARLAPGAALKILSA